MTVLQPTTPALRTLALWLLLPLLAGCQGQAGKDLALLAERYIALHDEGDVEGLLEWIAFPNDSPELRRFVALALEEETRWPIKDLQVAPLSPRERRELREAYPLPPLWRVYIVLDTEDRFTSVWLAGRGPEGVRLLVAREAAGR